MQNIQLTFLGVGLLAIAALATAQSGSPIKVGGVAPAISAPDAAKKTQTLKGYLAKGPVTLYFINIGCPVNHRSAPFMKKIDEAYKNKSNIVGVINGDSAAAQKWAKEYGTKFPILADPELKIIKAYGMKASPSSVVVGTNGKVVHINEDGSPSVMKVLNQISAKAAKAKVATVDFTGAPVGVG
jgi:peroxiredoxin